MPSAGWKRLVAGAPWFGGEGSYPIPAYSEFMPPPRLGPSAYGADVPSPFTEDDSYGWHVDEYEEELGLKPGLARIAAQVVGSLVHLGSGSPAHGIARYKRTGNLYWPPALEAKAGHLTHERFVVLLPLALSRTQDDKGRVRWSFFGGSEQGPSRAFWQSFYRAPGKERPAQEGLDFLRRLLSAAYGLTPHDAANLHRAGFRVYSDAARSGDLAWPDDALPSWVEPCRWHARQSLRGVRFVLTFHPFATLPARLQKAYLSADVHLIPFPGSLLFWGVPAFARLREQLPLAMQIPLLHMVKRHEGAHGIRVPQSGWMHERPPEGTGEPDTRFGPILASYQRTHRNSRVPRDAAEIPVTTREDKLAHVLFSSKPEDMGLYDKPMARNVQIWTDDFALLLDGPNASRAQIEAAASALAQGGLFGYRMQFPAMRVGQHDVYWHRPLVAYLLPRTGEAEVLPDAPLGYLTAYRAGRIDVERPVELWPRLLRRDEHLAGIHLFEHAPDPQPRRTTLNVHSLLEAHALMGGQPLPRTVARSLLTIAKDQSVEAWLDGLPALASDPERGQWLADALRARIEPERDPDPEPSSGRNPSVWTSKRTLPEALTYAHTARRSFEVAYWNTIVALSHGHYLTKNNADVALDPATRAALRHHHRDLDPLGAYLIQHYERLIRGAGLAGKALVGDLPFRWRTDFAFDWSGGWLRSQEEPPPERDIIVVIPGRNRSRAVIMADHYDTAYMADHYEPQAGGNGARIAAPGADDNASATAALMLGARVFLELSRAGTLGCDVWLVHLTGEEFPADCLGARHLAQCLVEGTLALRLTNGRRQPLNETRVQGVFVLDMVAHNNDHERDIFQIAPGTSREAMHLAREAHVANAIWNASTAVWNRRPARKGRGRARRQRRGLKPPPIARHLALSGEIRPHFSPRSTLYNTDAQIFSDAGIPGLLFMENYDINRSGYHDSQDTMANIDLDYGSALAAIAIETVARAALAHAGASR